MSGELINQIIIVLIYIGGPLLPLLFIAMNVSQWHRENPDPLAEFSQEVHEAHSH